MKYDNDFRDPTQSWSWSCVVLILILIVTVTEIMFMKRMYGNDNHGADADAVDDAQMMLWTMPRFEHFARIHWVLPRANAETFQLPRGVPHHKSLSSQGTSLQYLHIFLHSYCPPKVRFCGLPWANVKRLPFSLMPTHRRENRCLPMWARKNALRHRS